MTTLLSTVSYPSGDGQPLAETFLHLYAILTTLEVLRQYLEGTQATVLANQFLYYAPGVPTSRVAPDVMVIFGVEPGGRDNYKSWEEGQVPAVIFEITSAGTRNRDQGDKLRLYEFLGVQEYWLFDPKGEWIAEKLRGYRLQVIEEEDGPVSRYQPVEENLSERLQLRLQVEGDLIGFYRLDNGQKLLIPAELASALRVTAIQLEQEREARRKAEQRAAELAERLRALGIDPDQ
ncbi:Uma2 family endonuclease [Gloeobacter kilaueensis]|uniref:Uma2 family endonuclease n=1 Tax=Gloeobacter kilaueensis TaxID=1416614 RepID=UPI00059E1BB5